MKSQMTHQERVKAALAGQEVDRPPISMWRHFYAGETSAEGLAEAMLSFQRRFDWDFMKVNPRASYHAEAWGLKVRYDGDRPPVAVEHPVKVPEDWLKLETASLDKGVLKEQLRALELIARGLGEEVPFLMTVFTPLSIASRLASSEEVFLRHLREHPENVRYALEVVTESFIGFSKACLERGASGLFFATTSWATTQRWTAGEYAQLARPYDLKLLGALPPARFHILHVCRDQNMLASLRDYPVQAFNWDARGAGNVSLAEGKAMAGGRAVVGGLPHGERLAKATPQELAGEVRGMVIALGRKGWMLGTGCTFPPETPEVNVEAIRKAVEEGLKQT
ncbi:MAG: uroporphyrinogen decarboxylase family protein [Chloroflexi bacterium]|nr:uroporphyrinogen decarboxylase family protein [Chloroflexota bacterium]